MKKINGGEFLLDISELGLEETEESTEIEDVGILEQLTNLKTFIKNPVSIKPIWIRLFNDDTNELVVVKGELSYSSGGVFNIHVKTRGYDLTINIQFTQMLNDNEDPIDDWYIDDGDATYEFTSNVVSSGTKLYRHSLNIITEDYEITATIISVDNQQYSETNLFDNTNIISVSGFYEGNDYEECLVSTFQIDLGLYFTVYVKGYSITNEQVFTINQTITSITDTVTEL